ncbi:hypothetical protein PAT3040_00323 [Paenibacillus agaridevorans]|uniref:Uncharacterized protein n=1 Tax=Paenibacillus agaridevorans TaxID=171404 RepID=A0A2R5ELJ6_9BACL|nr:hypothetical protein PAT3040_00323 [Paenibacillus agaridevorans]
MSDIDRPESETASSFTPWLLSNSREPLEVAHAFILINKQLLYNMNDESRGGKIDEQQLR